MSRIIYPVACHFSNTETLCDTTIKRLEHALKIVRNSDTIMLGGDVPYTSGGTTLGQLMQHWLVEHKVRKHTTRLLTNVWGTFSEARTTSMQAGALGTREILVISSRWYLFAGAPIWNKRAAEQGLAISYRTVSHTGGVRIWCIYALIGTVVRVAFFLKMDRPLEHFMTHAQKKRAQGFTFNGCT